MAAPSQSRRELSLAEALTLAMQLHQNQRDTEAEAVCGQILEFHPDQPDALHLSGLLAHGQGQNAQAIKLISRAIAVAPDQPDFQNSLGNILFEQGKLSEAEAAYRKTTVLQPDYAAAYSNLGLVLQSKGNPGGALAAFQKAIDLQPDDASAYNNLGVLLKHRGNLDGALAAFQKAITLQPNTLGALLNLADVLDRQNNIAETIATYKKVIGLEPKLAEAHYRLGHIYCCQGLRDEALEMLSKVVELEPDHAEAYFDLGKLFDQAGLYDQAIAAYRKSIAANPRLFETYLYLGNKLTFLGRSEEAAAVWELWLQYEPDNPTARHMLVAATGRSAPARAEDDYVRNTFDEFAESFDTQLQRLNYRAPQLIADVIACGLEPPKGNLAVLDAGCGTGLCALLLRPYAKQLTGVDLSPNMLEKAQQRGGYDELVTAELTVFMNGAPNSYDLIASADTLNYFGDLKPVFEAAARTLRAGGHFVFSLEKPATTQQPTDFSLQVHGRYCHTESYVQRSLCEVGFQVCSIAPAILRMEAGKPVDGLIIMARSRLRALEEHSRTR